MATLSAANLTLVIKATNEASKALKSVEGHLQLIVDAAAAANDAISQIADTAAMAADAACKAVTACQGAEAPAIDTQGMAAAVQSANEAFATTSPDTDAWGGFAEIIGTVTGKAVGFMGALGDIHSGIEALKALFGAITPDLDRAGTGFTLLQGPLGRLRGGFAGLANLGPGVRNAIAGIGPAVGTVTGPLSTLASGAFTRLAALGGALIPVIRGVGMAMMTLAMNPVGMIVMALTGLVAAGIAIWKNWDEISAKATEIWNTISGFLGGAMENITGMFSDAWDGITSFFSGMWEGLIGIFTDNWQSILGVIFPEGGLAGLIAENWGAITEKVGEIWSAVVGTVTEWWNNLMGILFPEEGGLFSRFQELFSLVMTWFDENVIGFFTGLPERIGELVSGIADVVASPFRSAFGVLRGFINRIVDAVNNIPSFEIPSWSPIGGGTTFSLPKLPRIPDFEFAEGGILRRPIVALAEREPEVIAPLSALGRMLPAGAGGPPMINVTIVNRGTIVHDRQFVDLVTRAYHIAQRQRRVP